MGSRKHCPARTLALLSILAISFYAFADSGNASANGERKVVRVVDGDRLILSPNERVRLIGVDTPETKHPKKPIECFGREATEFTTRIAAGKMVSLRLDEVNAVVGHKDKYGRTLGYVYLEDGTFLNAEIIRQGFGHAYTRFPFRYLEKFTALQREARERGVGLWSDCRRE